MTGPSHAHEPSPEFRAHLEWQLETAMRRESRLAEPVSGVGYSRWRDIIRGARRSGAGYRRRGRDCVEHMQDAKVRDQVLANTQRRAGACEDTSRSGACRIPGSAKTL